MFTVPVVCLVNVEKNIIQSYKQEKQNDENFDFRLILHDNGVKSTLKHHALYNSDIFSTLILETVSCLVTH